MLEGSHRFNKKIRKWYTCCLCNHIVADDWRKSRRDLMCVGRYAAKVMRNKRSEMEHNRSEMPANIAEQTRIPRDAISPPKGNLMLSHSAGMHNIGISIAGISKRFHFASLHYIFSAYLPTHIKSLRDFPLFWFVFFWGVGWRFFLWCVTMLYIFLYLYADK